MNEKTISKKYRVDNKFFSRLADARRYRAQLKASLPNDAVVTIYKAEYLASEGSLMWVPYE